MYIYTYHMCIHWIVLLHPSICTHIHTHIHTYVHKVTRHPFCREQWKIIHSMISDRKDNIAVMTTGKIAYTYHARHNMPSGFRIWQEFVLPVSSIAGKGNIFGCVAIDFPHGRSSPSSQVRGHRIETNSGLIYTTVPDIHRRFNKASGRQAHNSTKTGRTPRPYRVNCCYKRILLCPTIVISTTLAGYWL